MESTLRKKEDYSFENVPKTYLWRGKILEKLQFSFCTSFNGKFCDGVHFQESFGLQICDLFDEILRRC